MDLIKALRTASTVLLLTTLGLTGCTKNKEASNANSPAVDIFSNREIISVPDLYLVTLNAPALLSAAEAAQPGWTPSAEAKAKIAEEQNVLEQKLKVISPDIQILFRYRLVLNGLAIHAPYEIIEAISTLPQVKSVTAARKMAAPQALNVGPAKTLESVVNSVNFIGSDRAHRLGFRGEGMRVGVLDSGVDYTHAMLGGSGQKEDFTSTDPNLPTAAFPNAKVVGGIDLVGTAFNSGSLVADNRVPRPDANPIDEMGHGTHVAGTIAGHGDGVNTYSGVAPEAQIYAVKVFGKEGSTMDTVVIAGLEYAADPNGDLNLDDRLHVVNLSLGGAFGTPQIRYVEAIRNLSRTGTVVVAAAGNNGPVDYIVGAPGTSDEALSVAAVIDGSEPNWRFPAVKLTESEGTSFLTQFREGAFTKPIAEATHTEGELLNIGLADQELSDEVKAALVGKIALIQRGVVSFQVKIDRAAAAGAIGAVVYNNVPVELLTMSGDVPVEIAGVSISQEAGLQIIEQMKTGPVRVNLNPGETIDQPQIIDQITDFSSKGPRTEDNLIKPEVAAPGQRITSALIGGGSEGSISDGTSMATPHMAGAVALIRQAHPTLTADQIKSLVMNTSHVLTDATGLPVAIAAQGAGRVQVDQAIEAAVTASPFAFSLGNVQVEKTQSIARTLKLKNLTNQAQILNTSVDAQSGITVQIQGKVEIPANGEIEIPVRFDVIMETNNQPFVALDARIFFRKGSKIVLQIPAMAIRTEASAIQASPASAPGQVLLSNIAPNDGLVLAFNLLGEDRSKVVIDPTEAWQSKRCDLKSAGYRIVKIDTAEGQVEFVEFAAKLYQPVTSWELCDVSVLIDSDEDGIADQEIAGSNAASLNGISGLPFQFGSLLLDAKKARAIRLAYEQELAAGVPEPVLNYTDALIAANPMLTIDNSTLAVVLAPLSALAKTADGKLNIKLAVSANTYAVEFDDYLGQGEGEWTKIGADYTSQAHLISDRFSIVPANQSSTLSVEPGLGSGSLVLYYPLNQKAGEGQDVDSQQQIFELSNGVLAAKAN